MNVFVYYTILIIASGCFASNGQNWESFKTKHRKVYATSAEDQYRKSLFENASQKVEENNQKYQNGTTTTLLKVTKFAVLTDEEFARRQKLTPPHHIRKRAAAAANKCKVAKTTTTKKPTTTKTTNAKKPTTTTNKQTTTTKKPANVKVAKTKKTTPTKKPTPTKKLTTSSKYPSSIDWRALGAVTPVKEQGSCGGCWAFSATGALEGQWFKTTGKLVNLSQQQLLDCASAVEPNLKGCNGGNMDKAFNYVEKNKGIDTDASYPYVATVGTCRFSNANIGATCQGYIILPPNEDAILAAVATIGPVSVGIGVTPKSGLYSSGLFTSKMCTSPINHAVLIVGYGTNSKGKKYWIVKNSWGTSWGMEGYFHLPRGVNFCGVNEYATYPIV